MTNFDIIFYKKNGLRFFCCSLLIVVEEVTYRKYLSSFSESKPLDILKKNKTSLRQVFFVCFKHFETKKLGFVERSKTSKKKREKLATKKKQQILTFFWFFQ